MKVKFGMIVTNARGALGGHVFSDNASGGIAFTKSHPPKARSRPVSNFKTYTHQALCHYKTLTPPQQKMWDIESINYPQNDRIGNKVKLTGQQLFLKINLNLQNAGQTILDIPAPKIVPLLPPSFTITANHIGPNLVITYSSALDNSGNMLVVRATPNMSNGVSKPGSAYRQIATIAQAGQASDTITASWQAVFGSQLYAGQRIFIKIYTISTTCGAATPLVGNFAVIT